MLNRAKPLVTRWHLLTVYLGLVVLAAGATAWQTARSIAPASAMKSPAVAVIATTAGRVAILLVPALIGIPYLANGLPGRRRLHYWTGYAVVALSVLHTLATMYTPAIRHANATGLRLATVALLLLLVQGLVGIRLRQFRRASVTRSSPSPSREGRGEGSAVTLLRLHYLLMYATVAAIVSHVALNH